MPLVPDIPPDSTLWHQTPHQSLTPLSEAVQRRDTDGVVALDDLGEGRHPAVHLTLRLCGEQVETLVLHVQLKGVLASTTAL